MRNKYAGPNIRGLTFYEGNSNRWRLRKNINGDMKHSQTIKPGRA